MKKLFLTLSVLLLAAPVYANDASTAHPQKTVLKSSRASTCSTPSSVHSRSCTQTADTRAAR